VDDFIRSHDRLFVVEMNRGGQMHKLLVVSHPESAAKLVKVAFSDGLPATASWVREGILGQMNGASSSASKSPAAKKVPAKKATAKRAVTKKKGAK
jgi:2-oxoglutarate ferredoxin oxidoreductase subunit alpha